MGDPIYKGSLFDWGPHLLWTFLWLGGAHLLGGPWAHLLGKCIQA